MNQQPLGVLPRSEFSHFCPLLVATGLPLARGRRRRDGPITSVAWLSVNVLRRIGSRCLMNFGGLASLRAKTSRSISAHLDRIVL